MTTRNFSVKLTLPLPLSHLVTNLGPPTEITSLGAYNTPFKKAETSLTTYCDCSFLIPTSAVKLTLLAFAAECCAVEPVASASPLVVYARCSAGNPPHYPLLPLYVTHRHTSLEPPPLRV